MTNSKRTRTGITMKIPPFRHQITSPLLVSLVFLPCFSRSSRISPSLPQQEITIGEKQAMLNLISPPIFGLFLTATEIILERLFYKTYNYETFLFFLQYQIIKSILISGKNVYFSTCRETIKKKGYFSSLSYTIRKTC